jgi:Ca-activated chloride channel family protein
MKRQPLLLVILALMGLLSVASPVLADGFIIIDPPPPLPDPEPVWLTIRTHQVDVTIADQVATTRVDQVFVNEHEWEVEGTYIFPLPTGAAVSRFVMWVDGEPVEAEVLPADEARAIYEDIVRSRRDPALLEYVGRDVVRARIFPIPPGGERRIELEYTQVLPVENGLVRYVYPLDTERFSARPLGTCAIRVSVESADPIRALYSPTHQDRVFIERDGQYRAVVGYEETDVLPTTNFELIYTVSPEDVDLNLLTYSEGIEDGHFLLLVAPSVEAGRTIPRDVLLVLDTSGSMDGEKIEQAREALIYVLEHLNAEDRFNVIAFSSGLQSYAGELRPASEADEAADWVRRLEAIGGTDINRALLEALQQVDPERPAVLIFLTDGLPTEGVTEVPQILANVEASAGSSVRLFPFGVGYDVNTTLLDTLADRHRGTTGYVQPGEHIDEQVSSFYTKVSTPVLSDIELDFDRIVVEDVYPRPLPDLFAGTQLILTGRYRGDGPARITLTGRVEGSTREYVYEGTFRSEGGDPFIPRLWAARKIGYLLTQIRLYGEEEEWVDAVIELSTRYGIITPYTSFLIEEDLWSTEAQEEARNFFYAQPAPAESGNEAVQMADEQAGLRETEAVGDAALPESVANEVRHVDNRTFVYQDGVWVDTTYQAGQMERVPVEFGSASYFELLESRPEWASYLALGRRVLFVVEGTAYEVVEEEVDAVSVPPALPSPTSGASSSRVTPLPTNEALSTPLSGDSVQITSEDPAGGLCLGAGLAIPIALAFAVVRQRMQGGA